MHYRPLLENGQEAPLSWQIICSYINGTWPTKDNLTPLERNLDRLKVLLSNGLLFAVFFSQMYEIFLQQHEILITVQLLLNLLITLESMIRIGYATFRRKNFKEFLNEFYSRIYFDEATYKEMHSKISKQSRPVDMYSFWYLITLMSFHVVPIYSFITGQRYLTYVLTIPFDYQPWPIYLTILILFFVAGVFVMTVVTVESYQLATSILNLNGRFVLLEEEILNLGNVVLKGQHTEDMADNFNERLIVLIKQNVDLIKFAEKLESQFTLPLFVMMGDSALMLCLMAFNTHEMGLMPASIKYITWLIGKVLELIVLGYLGSVISSRVDGLGTTYYVSGWEKVIYKSQNSKANIRTMKLITRAIAFNQRAFMLSGMGFFNISLETSVTVLRVAGSYFTFLCSMR